MPKVKALLTKMRCIEETSEPSSSNEPYVLVFAAHLKKIQNILTIPAAHTVMYGPWKNVDDGDLMSTSITLAGQVVSPAANFWGLDGQPQELSSLNEVIFIAALMENDDAAPAGIRAGLHAQMFAAITSYANAGISRTTMVNKLKKDMRDVLTGVTVTGIPSSDDLVGVAEVAFPQNALQAVLNGPVVKNITLAGDGGQYRLRFELVKG